MYAKLFKSLFEGSMRGKSDIILIWINLLANADQDGFVDRHFRAIADETGLPLERVRAAISELESPDADSRSKELDGRRIERMDEHREWGWRIVNHAKYRALRNTEERRTQNRLAQERFREKRKQNSKQGKQKSAVSAHTDTDTDTKKLHCLSENYEEIVAHLNLKSKKHFQSTTPQTQRLISARLKEGFSLENFFQVIDHQCKLWMKDPRMSVYLRPETLFGTKFEGYLNDVRVEKKKWEDNKPIPTLTPLVQEIKAEVRMPYDKKAEDCTSPKKVECQSPYCKATCRFRGVGLRGEAK